MVRARAGRTRNGRIGVSSDPRPEKGDAPVAQTEASMSKLGMEGADMANSTPPDGSPVEPALIYDAGERRTHAEHAAEAYDCAQRSDALATMSDATAPDFGDEDEYDAWVMMIRGYRRASIVCRDRAQWHATMAVYEALQTFARRPL